MHKNYEITELPEKYYDKEATEDACDKAMCEMVNKYPAIFIGERWDKYRESTEEQEDDNKSS